MFQLVGRDDLAVSYCLQQLLNCDVLAVANIGFGIMFFVKLVKFKFLWIPLFYYEASDICELFSLQGGCLYPGNIGFVGILCYFLYDPFSQYLPLVVHKENLLAFVCLVFYG